MNLENKSFIYRFTHHFKTITYHRLLVCHYCFKVGLYKQGLIHDLSKYSLIEFFSGVRYYQGNRSPIDKEKEVKGVSYGWLHHKGHNKHHWEYWVDFNRDKNQFITNVMPPRYLAESICDRLAACKTYLKDKFKDDSTYQYYMNSKDRYVIHPVNDAQFQYYLKLIGDIGFNNASQQIKEFVRSNGQSFNNKKDL